MEYKDDMFKPEERPCCDGCDKECELFTGVNVPVEIEPDAKVGKIDVECCGEPEIKIERCHDCKQKIVITQKFFVKIPICFKIKTEVGKSEIDCKKD